MPTFDIGLVMAGAVSAGAYTAGAIDFLFQALDEWHVAKTTNEPDVPKHDVQLKVITGASAGGITAAIVAAMLDEKVPPIDDYPATTQGDKNKLFDAWVNLVDIEQLLAHTDLDNDDGPVRSLLDSTVLDRIGVRVFQPSEPLSEPRLYIADTVYTALTVTNLRGVPYKINFTGISGSTIPYVMTLHADAVTFAVERGPTRMMAPPSGVDNPLTALRLNTNQLGQGDWLTLREAALASGAFPLGLIPRTLSRNADVYKQRSWYFPDPHTVNGEHHCGRIGMLDPYWNVANDYKYDFLCVDGGTMDNEPVGLARALLTTDAQTGVESHQPDTQAAILMIDPFPDATPFQEEYSFHNDYSLYELAPTILRSLINQARFKPDELTRAMEPDVFNQFLLAPVRYSSDGTPVKLNPIASGGLSGFAGFLSRDFRLHDFQLGRLNAQRFLQRHFTLPEKLSDDKDNPLFSEWSESARARYRIHRDEVGRVVDADGMTIDQDGNRTPATGQVRSFLPVVPLMGKVTPAEAIPDWPVYARSKLETLRRQISDRATHVADRLVEKMEGWWTRRLLYTAWRLKRSDVIDQIISRIETDLDMRDLLQK